ncbi:MAG: 50S ribosomal protein L13 [Candidatus Sericytochromatia bacterium]|nr:50S ribosomal protein L13 [Candidatus Sericytochromatia bacterium]
MQTTMAKESEIVRQWHLVDAEGQTLGRLATVVANLLRGKNKPIYTPHVDTGDFVVIINADKIVVTGKKTTDKEYIHHTGWPGGFRKTTFNKLLVARPIKIIEKAVRGMIPHTKLGAAQFRKLKVYAGPEHPHAAQQPQAYDFSSQK